MRLCIMCIKRKKVLIICIIKTFLLAVRTGLEPATPCVTGMYSNQLNYRTILFVTAIPLNCDAKIGDVFESCNTSSQLFFIFFYSYLIIKQLFVKKK